MYIKRRTKLLQSLKQFLKEVVQDSTVWLMNSNTFEVDKITWNDLSLEELYSRLNSCITSAGDDYLYNRLKNPYIKDCDEFDSFRKLKDEAEIFAKNEELLAALNKTSKLKNYNFNEELNSFSKEKAESNLKHYVIGALVVLSFLLFFVYPGPAIVAFFAMIAYAVSDYFKTKNIIAGKLTVFTYLIKMIKAFSKLKIIDGDTSKEFLVKASRLKDISKEFAPFIRGTFLISEGARTNSNPLSIVFDYIRMIFHVDIIKYNSMISFLQIHLSEAFEFYSLVGEIDSAICLSKMNEIDGLFINEKCNPEFIYDSNVIDVKDAYHPQVEKAVCNSITSSKNVLITGCNASGKSTFLKTIAINAIFAQSFGICFAKSYKAPYYKVYSSMALRDDINAKESYFMSEIKSLKRIIDESRDLKYKTLCFVDEVLRGTNTVERIAASTEILKSLCKENIMCFAATHDIELTELLKDDYNNYHFTEEILDNDVVFSFKIMDGAANSRNAIRLLSVLGYDEDIVSNASKRADMFIKEGIWT